MQFGKSLDNPQAVRRNRYSLILIKLYNSMYELIAQGLCKGYI